MAVSGLWRAIVAAGTGRSEELPLESMMDAMQEPTLTGVPMTACAAALERRPRCLRLVPCGEDVMAPSALPPPPLRTSASCVASAFAPTPVLRFTHRASAKLEGHHPIQFGLIVIMLDTPQVASC